MMTAETLLLLIACLAAAFAYRAHTSGQHAAKELERLRAALAELRLIVLRGGKAPEDDGAEYRVLWRAKRGTGRAKATLVREPGSYARIDVERYDLVLAQHSCKYDDPSAIEREAAWLGQKLADGGWVGADGYAETEERRAFDKQWDTSDKQWSEFRLN